MAPQHARRRFAADLALFAAAVVLVAVPAVARLHSAGYDPTVLLNVGDRSASRPFVERDLPDPVLLPGFGHDGQQFYVIARTIPHLQRADGYVDRLVYRARRILFPLVVSPFPAGPVTVWAMLAVNLAAAGLAAVGLGRLATRAGLSLWVGLGAALSPALIVSARASLADGTAFALAIWGVVVWRRHAGWAAGLFALAALAREQALVAPFACLVAGLLETRRLDPDRTATATATGTGADTGTDTGTGTGIPITRRRDRWPLALPFGVYLAWSFLIGRALHPVRSVGDPNPLADVSRIFGLPFQAWFQIGFRDPTVVFGIALAVGSVAAIWTLWRPLPELAVWLAAEAVLLVASDPAVSAEVLNYGRVAPLAVPAFALALGVAMSARRPQLSGARARRRPAGGHR